MIPPPHWSAPTRTLTDQAHREGTDDTLGSIEWPGTSQGLFDAARGV